jgi:acetolactate synthase-1/2/3 large subunit
VLKAEQVPQVLARAFAIFAGARPRPVHIEIPIDVITAKIDPALSAAAWPLPTRPAPAPDALSESCALLAAAKAPVMVLGGGAADAAAEARALVEHLDAPVVHTVNAKGILPPHHPLRAGENMAMPPLHRLITEADVVLAVGTEFGETEMYPDPQPIRTNGKLIRIDIDPEQLVRGLPAALPIQADARLALGEMLRRLSTQPRIDRGGAKRAAEAAKAVAEHWWPAVATHRRIAAIVQESLPDVIMVGDSAEPVYALNQCFEPTQPRSYFNSSTGYGTLGYGLPAGIGAKLAAPERPVIVLVGDGGLQFTIGELAAAVEAEAPVILLLWNNHGYGEIKTYMEDRQIKPIGVDIFTPDFQTIAKGFGCAVARPETPDQLTADLRDATRRKVPTLIELRAETWALPR